MKVSLSVKPTPRKDGMSLVSLVFTYSGKKHFVSTRQYVLKEYWNSSRQMLDSYKMKESQDEADRINEILLNKVRITVAYIKSINKSGEPFDKEALTIALHRNQENATWRNSISLSDYFDFYKEQFKGQKSQNTLRKGNQVIANLKEFKPHIDWRHLTFQFWNEFTSWCIEEKEFSGWQIRKHAVELKNRCRAVNKVFPDVSFPSDVFEFTYTAKSSQPFWLSWDEVEAIKDAPCISRTEEIVRDQFVLTCHLGVRDSDAEFHSSDLIKKGDGHELRVTMLKTGLDYNIPLHDDAKKILEKYDFRVPRFKQQTHNSNIKNIAKRVIHSQYKNIYYVGIEMKKEIVDRYKMISTHTARRTFARHWLDQKGSLPMLTRYLGQSSPEITLMYVGYTPDEITDEFRKVFG